MKFNRSVPTYRARRVEHENEVYLLVWAHSLGRLANFRNEFLVKLGDLFKSTRFPGARFVASDFLQFRQFGVSHAHRENSNARIAQVRSGCLVLVVTGTV